MPTKTYKPIATTTLSSNQTTVTFSSIPATYTDLVLIMAHSGSGLASSVNGYMRFNSDSGTNYSKTQMLGVAPNYAQSQRYSSTTRIEWPFDDALRTVTRFNIMNYANTSIYKTTIMRQDMVSYGTGASIGLWRSTSAIDTISLTASDNLGGGTADQFTSGSTFTLYGIL